MSSYLLPSAPSLLAYLNAKNATTFTLDDVVFSTPTPINGTWREVANPHNTAVRVSAKPGGKYQGSQVITYDRLKLSDLLKLTGWRVNADHPTTSLDLLPAIAHYQGIQFSTDDIESTPVTDNGDGTFTCTLTAKAGSLGWQGSVVLSIKQGGASLDAALPNADLPGLNYPTASDADVYADLYLYGYDFTGSYADLMDVEPDETLTQHSADALALAINQLDVSSGKGLWNSSDQSAVWSLFGATCTYSGLNKAELLTNPAYKYVTMIQLRPDVTTPRGTLIFHYNDPIDSSVV
jgi:hypothetical protein